MSKDSLQNDPKSDLRFFIQELQQFKKQRQLFQIQLKAEELHGYLSTLIIPYVTLHHLQGYLVLVARQAHSLRSNQFIKDDSEYLEKQFHHVELPLNDVIVSIESILRNPKILSRKVPKKTDKKIGIIKKLFGNNSQSNQVSDNEEPLEIDVERNEFEGIMNIFISHKFVKVDQELAIHLEKLFKENNLYGYIAERKKEYEKPLSEKIKSRIKNSHYLVAILTKNSLNSPSVNQEIGYAIGLEIPVLLMVEKGEIPGVLVQGYENEEFSRQNFSKACTNIMNYIIDHGRSQKTSAEDKEWLKNNAYRDLYNKIKKIHTDPDQFKAIPPNPWAELEPFAQIKVESDVRKLFEEYSMDLEKWKDMFLDLQGGFISNQHKLGEIVRTAFHREDLINNQKQIILDDRTTQEPRHWLDAFKFIIFDNSITSDEILYQKLLKFSKETNNGHKRWLERWKSRNPLLYRRIFQLLPELRAETRVDLENEEISKQSQILKNIVDKLVTVLENKLSN